MSNEKKTVREFVQKWINGHEVDSFIKNRGALLLHYSEGGGTGINLERCFEDIVNDALEEFHPHQDHGKTIQHHLAYAKEQIALGNENTTYTFVVNMLEQILEQERNIDNLASL